MDVSYRDNVQLGPGNGFFILHGEDLDEGEFRIFLQRSVDQRFLSNAGEWVDTQQSIQIEGYHEEDTADLWLPLPPSLVNALNTADIYRMTLCAEDRDPLKATVRIQEISYSPEKALQNTIVLEKTRKTIPSAVTEEPPVAEAAADPGEAGRETQDRPEEKKRGAVWILLLLLLLAAGLGCGYYFWKERQEDPQSTGKTPEETTQPSAPLSDPGSSGTSGTAGSSGSGSPAGAGGTAQPARPEAGSTAPVAAPLTTEQQVQRFFRSGERNGRKAGELIRSLSAGTPEEQDALFRLYYYAAEQGETGFLMEYAACLDPSKPAWGTIQKNAVDAWQIYAKAGASDERALTARKDLLAWLRKEADAGNREAVNWLQQLPETAPAAPGTR